MNWKRIALVVGAAVAGGVAAILPPTAAITLPVLGKIGAGAALASVATYLTGWAQRTPGQPKPKLELPRKP